MNFIDVANEILKTSLLQFKETNRRNIPVSKIYKQFAGVDDTVINDGFRQLAKDGLIKNTWASNRVYFSELQLDAIIQNTNKAKLEKLYSTIKELRDWIPGY